MENIQPNKETTDIVILVNGPGELSSYVRPIVLALNEKTRDIRLILVFTPCPYSTGKEIEIAKKIPAVVRVITKEEFIGWALLRKPPKDIKFSTKGVVVFLGGDILYGKMIAKRLKYPAIAYSEAYAKWPKIYRKFLVPDQMIFDKFKKQGFPENQIKIVGNLMVDSIKLTKKRDAIFSEFRLDPKKKLVSFMPGSREFQVQFTFLFFAKTAKEISMASQDIQFAYIISPYLPKNHLDKHMKKAGFTLINDAFDYQGIKIKLITNDQLDAIAASDLIITIPGTNTAEVAIIGTPMISVFPLASAQLIPLEGLNDIIGRIPLLGFFFKNLYVKIMQSKIRFFAIPNIKTGREIVPDLRGAIQPRTIAEGAVALLNNKVKLENMRRELKVSLGGTGAAHKVAEEIFGTCD